MPQFGKRSLKQINTVHQDLATILHYAIQVYDFSVISGKRTAEEQFNLFKKGRVKIGDSWVITDRSKVVTYKDGINSKSNHQSGRAVDLMPYPSGYKDQKEFFQLAGVIKGVAGILKKYGSIEHEIEWGYDLWSWDEGHFQFKD